MTNKRTESKCNSIGTITSQLISMSVLQTIPVWTVRGTEELKKKKKLEPVMKSSVTACLKISTWKEHSNPSETEYQY